MKNKCIISFIKRIECNYSEETHEKIEKGKQINKRCTYVKCIALATWECVAHLGVRLWAINARTRDLNTRPLLATSLNPFYKGF